ncbi:methionyl-tRNA formyltransferase [Legionella shakespearei]|uniref:Methionyl tRNA formyltransferase n=1 Tax=Legionella shakespearei DSM 23087 TaxID=1122169 RepID=A0A0W0YV41_9GAMM|nr:formyltransferase family protein [Legionella shakespearei]KTD60727.1 methionyl tRNA formyltransferase [Legionella shakespearei DSM 23087]
MIKKALFIGSKQFGLDTLKLISELSPGLITRVITCDDSKDPRNRMDEFIAHAKKYDLDLFVSKSKSVTHEIVKDYQPDLCFVNGWYQLLLEETLVIPKFGVIGIHHSLLPKYRGGSPLVWQIINNEEELGTSIFYLDKGMDSGDIILQTSIRNKGLYIDEARQQLEKKVLNELRIIWPEIISDTHEKSHQCHENATYCAQLLEEDGEINWSDKPENILSGIRARSLPYPCAYFFYKEEKIRVTRAKPYDTIIYGLPGQLVAFEEHTGYPVISCGNGKAIVIEKILAQDNQLVAAQQVLSSTKIRLA